MSSVKQPEDEDEPNDGHVDGARVAMSEFAGPMFGLIAGWNCLIEALVEGKVIDPVTLAGLLERKQAVLTARGSDTFDEAARVVGLLRRPVESVEQAAIRRLMNEPTRGSG